MSTTSGCGRPPGQCGSDRTLTELEHAIKQWVERYNHHRYHESLNNVTPADVFFGKDQQVLSRRDQIKRTTLAQRKIENLRSGVVQLGNRLLAKRIFCRELF